MIADPATASACDFCLLSSVFGLGPLAFSWRPVAEGLRPFGVWPSTAGLLHGAAGPSLWDSAFGLASSAPGNLLSALSLGLRALGLASSFCSCLPPAAPAAHPGVTAVIGGANAKVQHMLFVLSLARAYGWI